LEGSFFWESEARTFRRLVRAEGAPGARQGRMGEQVRRDWSKQIIDGSSIAHLDAEAIYVAREHYKTKQNSEHISAEVDRMTNEEFLAKQKLIIGGKLTNAAMVLLGEPRL
jgi:ATP-dependent DNA helicase RecG